MLQRARRMQLVKGGPVQRKLGRWLDDVTLQADKQDVFSLPAELAGNRLKLPVGTRRNTRSEDL